MILRVRDNQNWVAFSRAERVTRLALRPIAWTLPFSFIADPNDEALVGNDADNFENLGLQRAHFTKK